MATTDDRILRQADSAERATSLSATAEPEAAQAAPGVGRFGATAAKYFVVAFVLALLFALVIVYFAQ